MTVEGDTPAARATSARVAAIGSSSGGIQPAGAVGRHDDARSIHASHSRARERQRHLEAEGWHIIRVGWHDLDHPDELVAQVRAALAARLG